MTRSRAFWTPAIGRTYGIAPWEMGRLTRAELEGIWRDQAQLGDDDG